MRHKLKVVIDTNVFVSAYVNRKGPPAKIIDLWIKGAFELYVSNTIIDEYLAILLKIGVAPSLIRLLNRRIIKYAKLITPSTPLIIIKKDPSDNKFLECALSGEVDFIVSGDNHLIEIGTFRNIQIIRPAEFLKILSP